MWIFNVVSFLFRYYMIKDIHEKEVEQMGNGVESEL